MIPSKEADIFAKWCNDKTILWEQGKFPEWPNMSNEETTALYVKEIAIGFAMWVHFNWQHLGDKFFLQKDGLDLDTIEEIEKTAITKEQLFQSYLQTLQQ